MRAAVGHWFWKSSAHTAWTNSKFAVPADAPCSPLSPRSQGKKKRGCTLALLVALLLPLEVVRINPGDKAQPASQ